MWAVIGLGNPGRGYSETRHNVGFSFVRRVARDWKVRLRKRKYFSKCVEVRRKKDKVLLAIPQTYMNRSGVAVKQILEATGVKPGRLIVVYDDLDIPLGDIRIRKAGGAGTHNGMNSIVQEIQTTRFTRIRIGIASLVPPENAVDFVLSSFNKAEKPLLEECLKNAQGALEMILDGEVEKAMNMYNQRGKHLQD